MTTGFDAIIKTIAERHFHETLGKISDRVYHAIESVEPQRMKFTLFMLCTFPVITKMEAPIVSMIFA